MGIKSFFFNKQKPDKTGIFSFNQVNDFLDAKYDYSKPYINYYSNMNYVPFGQDNLYPYVLMDMYTGSPFHAAIIDFKVRSIIPAFELTSKSKSLEDSIKIESIKKTIFNKANLTDILYNWILHERVYFYKDKSNVSVKDSQKLRHSIKGDTFFYNLDWRQRRGQFEEFKKFDKIRNPNDSIISFVKKTPGFDIYPVPSYSTAANWIFLDSQIAFYQKQNMENSINPAAIIHFYKPGAGDEEKRELIEGLKTSYGSARNAGKTMVFVNTSREEKPDVEMMDANRLDRAFVSTQENIIKNVSYAHGINPAIMGIATAGSLGAKEELETAYSIYRQNYVEHVQYEVEDILNQLLKILDYDLTFKIIPKQTLIS